MSADKEALAKIIEASGVKLLPWQQVIADAVIAGKQVVLTHSRSAGRQQVDALVEEFNLMMGTHAHLIHPVRGTVCLNGDCAGADEHRRRSP